MIGVWNLEFGILSLWFWVWDLDFRFCEFQFWSLKIQVLVIWFGIWRLVFGVESVFEFLNFGV